MAEPGRLEYMNLALAAKLVGAAPPPKPRTFNRKERDHYDSQYWQDWEQWNETPRSGLAYWASGKLPYTIFTAVFALSMTVTVALSPDNEKPPTTEQLLTDQLKPVYPGIRELKTSGTYPSSFVFEELVGSTVEICSGNYANIEEYGPIVIGAVACREQAAGEPSTG